MRSPLERWRQKRARRRYMPHAPRRGAGTTAKFAMVALVVILAAAALLELRRGGGAEADLVAYARENRLDPLDMVEAAARSRQLVFLSDITSAVAPKEFAARAIERLATTSGLDLVVLDIDAEEQPFIDRYLATAPEDASILMGRPRAIREDEGVSRAVLDIYRTVWRVNRELGADRRIRIVAADQPGWPPSRATSPSEAARLFGRRGDHMLEAVETRALARSPSARVFFFVDGLHALKTGGGRVQTGGARPVDVTWLAAALGERRPQDVFTILVDAQPARVITPDVVAYRGTEAADELRRAGVRGYGLRVNERFDAVARSPIRLVGTTGLTFTMMPRAVPMSQLADAYIFFGS